MRSSEEFRRRKLDELANVFERPMLWGSGKCIEMYLFTTLKDLCWLDNRRQVDFATVESRLLNGCLRVYGQFLDQRLAMPDQWTSEIVSTYAQAAFRLGYFTPGRLLSEKEFQKLKKSLDRKFFAVDHTQPELTAQFGQPSFGVGGCDTIVDCYACTDAAVDWIYFDYSRRYPPADPHVYEWFDEPILRDVRRKRNRFELLPFAEWCKTPTARKS